MPWAMRTKLVSWGRRETATVRSRRHVWRTMCEEGYQSVAKPAARNVIAYVEILPRCNNMVNHVIDRPRRLKP
jgi:hypothetical protein